MTHAQSGSPERELERLPGPGPGSSISGRASDLAWLLPAALLVAEVLALQARFTTAQFVDVEASWGRAVVALRELPRVALLAVTALLVLGRRDLTQELSLLRATASRMRLRGAWVALQLGAFALLWGTGALLLERDPAAGPPARPLLVGWPLLAGLCGAIAFRAVAPWSAWLGALRRRSLLTLAALALGGLAWLAGTWSQDELRAVLRLPTLRVAYALLAPFTEGAYIAPQAFEFGTPRFAVDLAPGCSGLDGIGLVGTFTAAWLVWMRKELRFPRALLLLPVAIATSWILNAARLAALVLVGEHASGEAAVAGFHSVAGLVLFCATAIGIVAVGSTTAFQRTRGGRPAPLLDATSAYLLPLLLWIAVGLLATALPVGPTTRLALRGAAVLVALLLARRHLDELLRAPTLAGLAVSAIGVAVALLLPRDLQEQVMARHEPGGALQQALAVAAAVVVAPLVEELAFRGYLLRRFASPHFETVAPRAAGVLGVVVSSILFGALHPAWGAGVAFGLLFAWAYLWRGRLSDAILAHAMVNLALVIAL